jgi:hypothetical protein
MGNRADCAKILGQTRAAVGKAWLEVTGRNIQFGVKAEYFHQLLGVDTQHLADAPNLICIAYFQSMERIIDVLDQFGDPRVHPDNGRIYALVYLFHRAHPAIVRCADKRIGGIEKVMDGRALAQELRIRNDREIFSARFFSLCLQ